MHRLRPSLFLLLAGLFIHAIARPALGAMGNITDVAQNGDTLIISAGADTLTVQACKSSILRLDYRPNGKASPPTAVLYETNWGPVGAHFDITSDPLVVTTLHFRAEFQRNPCRLQLYDATGTNLLIREQIQEGVFSDGLRLHRKSGSDLYGIHGYANYEGSGAGMIRNNGGWVEAGFQGDCGAPLAWSRDGYGLLVDSDGGQFNAGTTNLVFEFCSRTNIEYFLLVGDPGEIMGAVADISGKPPMFPKWAMGFANTEWDISQQELTNNVNGYRQRGIPIDHYILDFDWKAWGQDNYGEWRWNTSKFPGGPSGDLRAQMASKGIKLSGIMKPRIHVDTVQGNYATANDFWWPGSSYSDYFSGQPVNDLDFSIPACRAWFWDHTTNAFSTGITGWWNDEADQRGGGGGFFDNWQFMNMQKAMYEGQRSYSTQRVWSINRNFYLGAQRYAYAMWSGDIDTGFGSMAAQRERMLSAVNLGQAKWGMDIGGFNGGDPSPENYARWMQFGAFVPVYRVHGNQFQQRQPWLFGATAEAAAKAAIQLRYQLIPYIYSYERMDTETGLGLVRPLFHDHPSDPLLANYLDAWMFGDYLLAAPVVAQGQTVKSIYLPAGNWHDYFRGTLHHGGQTIAYTVNSATWTDIPLFIKEGAIIPTQPVMNYVGERPVTNLYVDVFPDEVESVFDYYDDDGTTYDYESGDYFKRRLTTQKEDGAVRFTIEAPTGSYVPDLEYFLCRIVCETNTGVLINDTPGTPYADFAALEAASGEGWAEGLTRFGYTLMVKLAQDGAAKSVVISNNLVSTPEFTPPGGTFADSVLVSLDCATTGATLRFTTDGSEPDAFSTEYTEPIEIFASLTLKARGFKEGRAPSQTAAATFTITHNLLNNPGFEVQGAAVDKALNWNFGDPDQHGEAWGTAARVNWRSHSGIWQGTLRGTWAGAGNTGGFWQEVQAVPGRQYDYSGWFWADSFWSTGVQGIKLEFLAGEDHGTTYLYAVTNVFGNAIGESWVSRSVTATAPAGADWVRVVVFAENVGSQGALQFDDLSLESLNTPTLLVRTPHSQADPPAGLHTFNFGQTLTNRISSPVVSGPTQYVCTGWSMTGHEPSSGSTTQFVMTITNDAELSWLWTTNVLEPAWLSFSSISYTENESGLSAMISIVRTGNLDGPVSVEVVTSNGTALAGFDYLAATGTVAFDGATLTNFLVVPLLNDEEDEPDETIHLSLRNPSGPAETGEPAVADLTVVDDDADQGQRLLSVISPHGQPEPPVGDHFFPHGVYVQCIASGPEENQGTQVVCSGWTGTGSAPAAPPPGFVTNTPYFALNGDSIITWLWSTNFQFARSAGANGTIAGDPDGWVPAGSNVTVTAVPLENFEFAGWTGDLTEELTNNNPLVLVMDQPRTVTAHFNAVANANLLNNPGFELQGAVLESALYWKPGEPDLHGDMWDAAFRINWRSHTGQWQCAVRGSWAGAGTQGGVWQEVPALPHQFYRFSGWFWADDGNPFGPWIAGRQLMKVEFFTGSTEGEQMVDAVTNRFSGVNQAWQHYSMVARSPATADWVRVVVVADQVGSEGALQLDDLQLEALVELPAPTTLPADPTNAVSFTANWTEVPEASGYLLEVATNSAFDPGLLAHDLFISEYGEGTGSERYIEVFNGTGHDVDLSQYRIWGISGGGNWSESSLSLAGTLAHGEAFVIRNENSASEVINTRADLAAANTAPMNFTGDDAVGLAKVAGIASVLLDAVGTSGADPGTGWGVDGVPDGTFNHTLVRMSHIREGNPDWATCSNEWVVLPLNVFTNVGEHQIEIRGSDLVGGFAGLPVGDVSSATATGLQPDTLYFYRVTATSDAGLSLHSTTSSVRTRLVAPTLHSADLEFSAVLTDRMTLTWAKGDGSQRLVVARGTNDIVWAPEDGKMYAAGDDMTNGAGFSTDGHVVVYNDTGHTVQVMGLAPDTVYFFRIFEYHGGTNTAVYLTTGQPASDSRATYAAAYAITASAGEDGAIIPDGVVMVPFDSDTSFLVQADSYFHIESVVTNSSPVGGAPGMTQYTSIWQSVRAPGAVAAYFAPDLATNHGTPHWWLAQHGLTNDAMGFDDAELNDSDQDEMQAWAEFVAGTSPTDSGSFFRVDAAAAGSFVLSWSSVSDRVYGVEFTTNPVTGSFAPLTSGLPATPAVNAWTDEVHDVEGQVFYRIRVDLE